MTASSILLILAIVAFVAVLPVWPHSKKFDFLPTGIAGISLVVVLVTYLARGGA